jgi:hypothetical protein
VVRTGPLVVVKDLCARERASERESE